MVIQNMQRCVGCRSVFLTRSTGPSPTGKVCSRCTLAPKAAYVTPEAFEVALEKYDCLKTMFVKPAPVILFPPLYRVRRDA